MEQTAKQRQQKATLCFLKKLTAAKIKHGAKNAAGYQAGLKRLENNLNKK